MDMRQRHSIVQEIIDYEEIKRLQNKIDVCEAVRMSEAKNETVRQYANDINQQIMNIRYGIDETPKDLYTVFGFEKKKRGRKKF